MQGSKGYPLSLVSPAISEGAVKVQRQRHRDVHVRGYGLALRATQGASQRAPCSAPSRAWRRLCWGPWQGSRRGDP
eukprot:11645543-Alexandrium_andersonii.AAC.1